MGITNIFSIVNYIVLRKIIYFIILCRGNEYSRIGGNSYEKVKTFKYLGSLLTNQNFIHEEIKCRLKAGNSCYYSVQTLCLLE